MPGREDLLAEEEPPRGVALLGALLLGVLLTLGDSIHDVVTATAQGGHLRAQGWKSASRRVDRQGRTARSHQLHQLFWFRWKTKAQGKVGPAQVAQEADQQGGTPGSQHGH